MTADLPLQMTVLASGFNLSDGYFLIWFILRIWQRRNLACLRRCDFVMGVGGAVVSVSRPYLSRKSTQIL